MSRTDDRIRPGDLEELIRTLDRGEPEDQCRALRLLCPCRNRVYDREAWLRIFRARHSNEFGVRDAAHHAIQTLRSRALVDPRTWDLLVTLGREMDEDLLGGCLDSIGQWGPANRPSRRKRMTACRTGRLKALASLSLANPQRPG